MLHIIFLIYPVKQNYANGKTKWYFRKMYRSGPLKVNISICLNLLHNRLLGDNARMFDHNLDQCVTESLNYQ